MHANPYHGMNPGDQGGNPRGQVQVQGGGGGGGGGGGQGGGGGYGQSRGGAGPHSKRERRTRSKRVGCRSHTFFFFFQPLTILILAANFVVPTPPAKRTSLNVWGEWTLSETVRRRLSRGYAMVFDMRFLL
jgi:hypothetical protein